MSTGIKLLCADQSTGVLRWPVTNICALGNVPTRIIIGLGVFGQPVLPTTTSTTAAPAIVVAAPSSGEVATTVLTTTTTSVAPSGGGVIRFGGTSNDTPLDSVVDNSGNLYTTGYFQGTVDFDPGAGSSTLTSAGGNDIFVSKLDSSDNLVWAVRIGTTTNENSYGVAVDGSGSVYVTGAFQNTVDFDPGAGSSTLTSAGGYDIFVLKLNLSGNFLWVKSFGQSNNDFGLGTALDSSGNVYITGYFQGTVDFDPGAGSSPLTSAGGIDVFVLKLDSSGNFQWAKGFGGTGTDSVYEIVVDAAASVYTTGYFNSTVDFDPGSGTANLGPAGGGGDVFVSKLTSSGNYVWAVGFGGIGSDYGRAIAVDGSGNVLVTGNFQVTVDFDPGAGSSNLSSAGDQDVFISKFDPAGAFVWAKGFGGTGYDVPQSISVDSSGNAHITGAFNGSFDFNPGAGTSILASAGDDDAFVSKIDQSGNFLWAAHMGGTGSDGGQSIEVDGSGNVRVVGYFSLTADFDPGAGSSPLTSNGSTDVFISRFDSTGALSS